MCITHSGVKVNYTPQLKGALSSKNYYLLQNGALNIMILGAAISGWYCGKKYYNTTSFRGLYACVCVFKGERGWGVCVCVCVCVCVYEREKKSVKAHVYECVCA